MDTSLPSRDVMDYLANRDGAPFPKVAIPSVGRCQEICQKTLRLLQDHGFRQQDIFVFVPKIKLEGQSENEFQRYRRSCRQNGFKHVQIVKGGRQLLTQYGTIAKFFDEWQYVLVMTDNVENITIRESQRRASASPVPLGLLLALTAHAWHVMVVCDTRCWSLQANKNPLNQTAGRVSCKFGLLDGNCYGVLNSKAKSMTLRVSNTTTDLEFSCRAWDQWGSFHRYLSLTAQKKYRSPGGLQRLSSVQRWRTTCRGVKALAKEFPHLVTYVPHKRTTYAGQPYRLHHHGGNRCFQLKCLLQNRGRPRTYRTSRPSSVRERVAAHRERLALAR
jgi:hypothetical protein